MAVTVQGASDEQLDDIYEQAIAAREERRRRRNEPPLIRIWENKTVGMVLRGVVAAEYAGFFEIEVNETAPAQLILPFDHHLAKFCWERRKREKQNVVLTIDAAGERWGGLMSNCTLTQDEDLARTVTVDFVHDYEMFKHLPCWANPLSPPALQIPNAWSLFANAIWGLKVTLFANLLRLNGSLWQLPDDPLDPESWLATLDYKRWQMVVKPSLLTTDTSPLRYIHSEFENFHDVAKPILEDCGLMITCRRWLIGDPQPWPGAGLKRNGQIVVDIVDKSGWYGQTSTFGKIGSGLVRTGLEIADNLVDETRIILDKPRRAPQYSVSGFLGVAPEQPWVVYRTNGKASTVNSVSASYKPASVAQVTVGGKSAPGVNELISASIKLIFNIMGSFILQPALGSVVESIIRPWFEDRLLAWMSIKSPLRSKKLGWAHFPENVIHHSGQAYTLSALLAMRKEFRDTNEQWAFEVNIGDGAPYLIGAPGFGHWTIGDRIGCEEPGADDGWVQVLQCRKLRLEWDADTPKEWTATLGVPPLRDPVEWAVDQINTVTSSFKKHGWL
ncbi:phage tail protein [Corynebacterium amycolatum]|uniref:Phage tail protein n=1 Tax=Corynebacterium amycolatum TaxID=43765 RepID=A0A7T4KQ57_CORAY|nr:phage tail protein [Corynebacterium amycolatum]QQB82807.1 phage tail protein [Corynebacterium amycolatum]